MAILEPQEDHRQFPRLAAGVRVVYRGAALRKPERDYLRGVADNVSLGGMFIATRRPLREGSLVWLEFHVPGDGGPWLVRARALVCWRRRWRRPQGMGVRFLEFENLGQRRLESWITAILTPGGPREAGSRNRIDRPDAGQAAALPELLA